MKVKKERPREERAMVIQKGTRRELVGAIEMEVRRRRFGFQPYLFHNVAMPNMVRALFHPICTSWFLA